MWLRGLLADLGFAQLNPSILYCDNNAAKKLIGGEADPKRTKHIDVKFHFVKECRQNGLIDIKFVSTTDQIADILTKPLGKILFKNLIEKLNLM